MKSSLQKLYKFFKLEGEHSYDNRAVIGGLERMLAPWEPEARLEGLPEELIHAVASRLRDYSRLSPLSRRESLDGLWKRIQREAGESIPDLALPLPVDKLPMAERSESSTGQEKSLPRKAPVQPSSASVPAGSDNASVAKPAGPAFPEKRADSTPPQPHKHPPASENPGPSHP